MITFSVCHYIVAGFSSLQWFDSKFSTGTFKPVKTRKHTRAGGDESDSFGLYCCPEDGCISTFRQYSSYRNHVDFGKHNLQLERETLFDRAKRNYATKLVEGCSQIPSIKGHTFANSEVAACPLSKGWALKTERRVTKFTDNQKAYLEDKFLLGEETGRKADPALLAKEMRIARNPNGTRLFSSAEFLTSQQIQGFFSRRARLIDSDNLENQAVEQERAYATLRSEVIAEVQISHPLTCGTYNLCKLLAEEKLGKLNLSTLKHLCENFKIDSSSFKQHRKAQYLDVLRELVENCSCTDEQHPRD